MTQIKDSFPVDHCIAELLSQLQQHGGALLQAPPGAGKSTRVPLALLQQDWAQGQRILMLQPRRMAARALAEFIAAQLGERVGQRVGYRTRLDSKVGADSRLEIITEGILVRMLLDDPELTGVALVIFDEFHLRSLPADLGLALVEDVRGALREDLRLLVMSATLDVQPLAEMLSLPVIASEGRSYPVTIRYQPSPPRQDWRRHCLEQMVACLQDDAQSNTAGVTLVFLPGVGELQRLSQWLAERGYRQGVRLLHGGLPPAEQQQVLAEAASGACRLVLTTNVAETSVTIAGVRRVIDCGLARVAEYDPARHRSRLLTRRISEASAVQRAGRAGRLGPGHCLRLWSAEEVLAKQTPAQITQVALDGLVLDLALWGCRDPDQLCWLDRPPQAAWQSARQRLLAGGALDADGRVTALGQRLARLPTEPQLGLLVLAGEQQGLADSAARVAVLLAEKDILGRGAGVDLLVRLARLNEQPRQYASLLQQAKKLSGGIQDRQPYAEALPALLAQVYPGSLARQRDGQPGRYQMAEGPGVVLPEGDPLQGQPWLLVLDTNGEPKDARIRLALALSEQDRGAVIAQQARQETEVSWDAQRQRVTAWRVQRLGSLVLQRQALAEPDPELVQRGLLAGLRSEGLGLLPWTPRLRQWQARVARIRSLQGEAWPAVDDGALLASLEQWLLPYLAGIRTLKALQSLPLASALGGLLSYQQQQQLEQLLPTALTLPTGRQAGLDYRVEHGPVLAVKLQELFGLSDLPILAEGQCRISVHLLTPAGRPAAITDNLARFWAEGYAQVRKDLRGRYPKHPWPEDPLTAEATAWTKNRQQRRR